MHREFRGPPIVGFLLVCMLTAIELDDELLIGASEVGEAVTDRMLAAEFVEWELLP